MTETDRIMRAMATMDEFTVADLVSACDASPSTVRTVLGRKRKLLEELDREATGRPGGKWKRYRLRPNVANDLTTTSRGEDSAPTVPLDLIAAEEILLSREAVDAAPEVRESLLRRSRRRLGQAEEDPAGGSTVARGHRHATRALITLIEGEGNRDPVALRRTRVEVAAARRLLPADSELLGALEKRVRRSPLCALDPPAAEVEVQAGATKGVLLEGVLGVVQVIHGPSSEQVGARLAPARRARRPVVAYARPTGRHLAQQARLRSYAPMVANLAAAPDPLPKHFLAHQPTQIIGIDATGVRVR